MMKNWEFQFLLMSFKRSNLTIGMNIQFRKEEKVVQILGGRWVKRFPHLLNVVFRQKTFRLKNIDYTVQKLLRIDTEFV